jgi:uncharacterized protein (DUF1330 family)
MTAYFVLVRDRTTNPDTLQQYNETAGGAKGDHPLTVLALHGAVTQLEGAATEGSVILSFPTKEDALAWYHSPAYQEVLQLRLQGSEGRGFIVEGV